MIPTVARFPVMTASRFGTGVDRAGVGVTGVVARRGSFRGGEFPERIEGYEFEGGDVGGFEDDGRGHAGIPGFDPAGDAEAPSIAGSEPGEVEFGAWGGEVISS